jgi:hypothetical protein
MYSRSNMTLRARIETSNLPLTVKLAESILGHDMPNEFYLRDSVSTVEYFIGPEKRE